MIEILLGALTMVMLAQFSALWYRMGKIEGKLKELNGCLKPRGEE